MEIWHEYDPKVVGEIQAMNQYSRHKSRNWFLHRGANINNFEIFFSNRDRSKLIPLLDIPNDFAISIGLGNLCYGRTMNNFGFVTQQPTKVLEIIVRQEIIWSLSRHTLQCINTAYHYWPIWIKIMMNKYTMNNSHWNNIF